jgi:hypothetical protein
MERLFAVSSADRHFGGPADCQLEGGASPFGISSIIE